MKTPKESSIRSLPFLLIALSAFFLNTSCVKPSKNQNINPNIDHHSRNLTPKEKGVVRVLGKIKTTHKLYEFLGRLYPALSLNSTRPSAKTQAFRLRTFKSSTIKSNSLTQTYKYLLTPQGLLLAPKLFGSTPINHF